MACREIGALGLMTSWRTASSSLERQHFLYFLLRVDDEPCQAKRRHARSSNSYHKGEYHMFSRIESTRRSNRSIFLPQNYVSPFNDTAEHISGLGLARIDFERCAVAGEVIYSVEGDSTPTSQQDEEARIATLAHAIKKLDNPEDAAEFMRCLNAICEGGDARYRQVAASYYYGEIAERGLGVVLKEMALIAMHLASLNPVGEVES